VIIDCHTHIFPAEMRSDRKSLCAQDEGFSAIYRNVKAPMAGAEELITSMDGAGVKASVICGFSWRESELCARHNAYLLESASRFPDRLIPFVSLPVTQVDWAMEALTQALRAGAKGVGEIAFYHREMMPRDLVTLKPLLTLMAERGIPLLLHANERVGHDYPGKGTTPVERFYELICSFPRLTIFLAHWGGGLLFYELMPEVSKKTANVYYDTAASPFLFSKKIYAIACRVVGADRILFGTDFPLLSPHRYFKELSESGLSEEDQRKILGLNLARLLAMDKGHLHET
jgi:predicted TIM-barrel fold metal-dependent hydrolase